MSKNIIICTYDEKLLPQKKTSGAVCRDLYIGSDFSLPSGEMIQVGSGIKTYIPHGRCAKVYARSGLPSKMGLMLANAIAIYDADYRGEYIMQFYNFTKETKNIPSHTRMTQIEFMPYHTGSSYDTGTIPQIEYIVDQQTYDNFNTLYPSDRGEGRFNSTGIS